MPLVVAISDFTLNREKEAFAFAGRKASRYNAVSVSNEIFWGGKEANDARRFFA